MSALMGLRTWKKEMSDLANKDSQMIKTKMGDVQYSDIGSGPVILHSHGSPGGCYSGPLAFDFYEGSHLPPRAIDDGTTTGGKV